MDTLQICCVYKTLFKPFQVILAFYPFGYNPDIVYKNPFRGIPTHIRRYIAWTLDEYIAFKFVTNKKALRSLVTPTTKISLLLYSRRSVSKISYNSTIM